MGGTVVYSPPSDGAMTFAWDDWAVGVILYAMVTRTLPFSREDLKQQKDLVLNVPHHISDGLLVKKKGELFRQMSFFLIDNLVCNYSDYSDYFFSFFLIFSLRTC